MMIYDLPRDLVEEILSRVPLKSMRAMRLTYKKWDTLSKSRSFTKLHVSKLAIEREEESRVIVMMDYNLYLMNVVINENPSKEVKGKLTCLNDSEQNEISKVFHCEGLLLCILEDDMTRVVVWNPYLGQTRSIKLRYYFQGNSESDEFSYALGYKHKKNKTFRSYKILRFIDDYSGYYLGNRFLWYEIYNFDSGLWKTLDITSPHWHIEFFDYGVTLKGNTYWIATKKEKNRDYDNDDYLICFDFTRERFGPLLSLPFHAWGHALVTLSCVREEKLAVLFQHRDQDHEVEIWITTKIDTENVSWSKFLRVDTRTIADFPISFSNGSFFIDEKKKVAMVFDKESHHHKNSKLNRDTINVIGEDGYYRKVYLGECEASCYARVCSYVPSLEQVKQQGKKRKRANSSLEKRRYDQNMLRLVEIDEQIKQQDEEQGNINSSVLKFTKHNLG